MSIKNTMDKKGRIMPYMNSIEISVEFGENGEFTTHAPPAEGKIYIWGVDGYAPKFLSS